VGRLNDLLLRKTPKEPGWKQVGGKLTLGMPWRHVDNQPLQVPIGNPLKGIRHDFVMLASNKGRPHLFHKGHEAFPA
jgi:hypothetical protein